MAQPPHPLDKLLELSSDFSLIRASPPPPLSIGLLYVLSVRQNLHQFLQPDQSVHWLNKLQCVVCRVEKVRLGENGVVLIAKKS